MNASLQHILDKIDQLTPEEKWQVMSHVMHQLQHQVIQPEEDLESQALTRRLTRARELLIATRGSWGSKTLDEIDAELDRQRREDWGE